MVGASMNASLTARLRPFHLVIGAVLVLAAIAAWAGLSKPSSPGLVPDRLAPAADVLPLPADAEPEQVSEEAAPAAPRTRGSQVSRPQTAGGGESAGGSAAGGGAAGAATGGGGDTNVTVDNGTNDTSTNSGDSSVNNSATVESSASTGTGGDED